MVGTRMCYPVCRFSKIVIPSGPGGIKNEPKGNLLIINCDYYP
ncbi:hypothetical protein SF123566_9392 [Shigella flexneri 1235-66]|nr:hypothetical protein SF123566_9392 [Shigella flexneri 1235-66]